MKWRAATKGTETTNGQRAAGPKQMQSQENAQIAKNLTADSEPNVGLAPEWPTQLDADKGKRKTRTPCRRGQHEFSLILTEGLSSRPHEGNEDLAGSFYRLAIP